MTYRHLWLKSEGVKGCSCYLRLSRVGWAIPFGLTPIWLEASSCKYHLVSSFDWLSAVLAHLSLNPVWLSRRLLGAASILHLISASFSASSGTPAASLPELLLRWGLGPRTGQLV